MIVVDTNVVAYLYMPGDSTAKVERLLERDPDWAVPLLWRSEFRNILAGYMRRRAITLQLALGLQAEAESLLANAEHQADSRLVLELARNSGCTAYDCEFVALAMTFGVRLVTMDGILHKAFPDQAVPLPAR